MAENTALDDLFNYDVGIENLLREPQEDDSNKNQSGTAGGDVGGRTDNLGIDEEIKITKTRAPRVKLDETRLLSQAGIPKLRKVAKTKLKFKGRHHEFSDVSRLLNFYQIWLDDLYPRAKFADGLAMIEKLGHSKRMQVMRKEWIDEGKIVRRMLDSDPVSENNNGGSTNTGPADISVNSPTTQEIASRSLGDTNAFSWPERAGSSDPRPISIFGNRSNQDGDDFELFVANDEETVADPPAEETNMQEEDEDDLDALLTETSGPAVKPYPPPLLDDEDDLSALLVESEPMFAESSRSKVNRRETDDFEDEYEVLHELGL